MQTTSAVSAASASTRDVAAKAAGSSLIRNYKVTSVAKTKAPEGADGNWYRYVLEGGRSPITGIRRGTLKEVTDHAKRCAADLNERNSGRSPSAWAPRKAKQS
jgi:hypothetical protein